MELIEIKETTHMKRLPCIQVLICTQQTKWHQTDLFTLGNNNVINRAWAYVIIFPFLHCSLFHLIPSSTYTLSTQKEIKYHSTISYMLF